MGRFLATIGAVALIIVFAFCMGWISLSTSNSDTSREKVELTVDKSRFKDDASKAGANATEIAREAKDEVKKIAANVGDRLSSKQGTMTETTTATGAAPAPGAEFTLNKNTLALQEGAKSDVIVTRSGGDQKALQVGVSPSPGSNLLASGGQFKEGETSASITVEAPKGARDGHVEISGGGKIQTLFVSVTP